ncbi:hypothetical protein DMC47_42995 [Nostoc sp. 3335mG]|nr:hypothetical protein DMC47_42995 [Nostoc sp. 3335mG]
MASVSLLLDGKTPDAALGASVAQVSVRQMLSAPALAAITFADPPDSVNDIHIGTTLAVKAPTGETLIEAEVTAVERRLDPGQVRTLQVRGYDRLHRLRKKQTVRVLENQGLGDLASAMANDIGISTKTENAPALRRALTVQHDQSDLDLLVQTADACGAYVVIADGALSLLTMAGDGTETITLKAGETILQARAESNAETMRRSTLARGWDVERAVPVEGRAGLATQDAVELRGADALTAFAGMGDRLLVNRLAASPEEATGLAQADMDRSTAFTALLDATVEGDPRLRPGRIVSLIGLGGDADGDYVLTETEHHFDAEAGYVTHLSTRPPSVPRRDRSAGATIARVSDTADPQSLGRVRARMVAFGDIESGWMPVLVLGAGEGKGIAILPEPGDDVLVLMPEGDPARGIVLGGLYGERTPPGDRPATGARTFTLRTPAGQVLTLDGARSVARIETGAGDVFEMAPEGSRMSLTRDLTVEAPGHSITFRASHIDFETA